MNASSIATVSTAVVSLVQLLKWCGLPARFGPLAVMSVSLLGVLFWAWSQADRPGRTDSFDYFAGWVVVSASAAGVFGFTRQVADAVTATKAPPPGAGADPTKPGD